MIDYAKWMRDKLTKQYKCNCIHEITKNNTVKITYCDYCEPKQ